MLGIGPNILLAGGTKHTSPNELTHRASLLHMSKGTLWEPALAVPQPGNVASEDAPGFAGDPS